MMVGTCLWVASSVYIHVGIFSYPYAKKARGDEISAQPDGG